MPRHAVRALTRLAAPLVLLLAACAGNTPPQSAGPTCLGQIRLMVTNDLGRQIEVHTADAASTPGPTLLGFVQAGGRREFVLPLGVRSVYTLGSEGGGSQPLTRAERRLVRFRYECEPTG